MGVRLFVLRVCVGFVYACILFWCCFDCSQVCGPTCFRGGVDCSSVMFAALRVGFCVCCELRLWLWFIYRFAQFCSGFVYFIVWILLLTCCFLWVCGFLFVFGLGWHDDFVLDV